MGADRQFWQRTHRWRAGAVYVKVMPHPPLNRIMHVDDARDIRDVVRLALETLGGFAVESCASGAEALARAPVFRPELVLLDEMMPEMDGPTTFSRLRSVPGMESVPIVFMTAQSAPADITRLKGLGALAVIAEPFDPTTLADQVRAIWGRRSADHRARAGIPS
jgi:CheY-like chemotaxis protein